MNEYLGYVRQEWRNEIPARIRGWSRRHWWPSRIKMLERERDDWMRWLHNSETEVGRTNDITEMAWVVIANASDWNRPDEHEEWIAAAIRWRESIYGRR